MRCAPHLPVYFINMDRSRDRLAHMLRTQRPLLPWPTFERVPAVDGSAKDGSATDLGVPPGWNGVAACLASHLRAVEAARTRTAAEVALVLEDDADLEILAGRWRELLGREVPALPPDWEILQLATLNPLLLEQPEGAVPWGPYNYCAVGYLVHRRGMDRLRGRTPHDLAPAGNFHADHALFAACRTYTTTRPYLNTVARDSTLHPEDVERDHVPARDRQNAWWRRRRGGGQAGSAHSAHSES